MTREAGLWTEHSRPHSSLSDWMIAIYCFLLSKSISVAEEEASSVWKISVQYCFLRLDVCVNTYVKKVPPHSAPAETCSKFLVSFFCVSLIMCKLILPQTAELCGWHHNMKLQGQIMGKDYTNRCQKLSGCILKGYRPRRTDPRSVHLNCLTFRV